MRSCWAHSPPAVCVYEMRIHRKWNAAVLHCSLQSGVALYSSGVHLVFKPVRVLFSFPWDCHFDKFALPLCKTKFIFTVILCHFYLILWFMNYWDLYSWWKIPSSSLSLECSFRVCVWKWLHLQRQPCSLGFATAICSGPRWHPPCVWLSTVSSREAVKVSVCLPSLWTH